MKTLQYWGTGNFQEHPYTGRIVTWTEKEKQTIDDAIATKLLAANVGFVLDNDNTGEVVTSQINSFTGGIKYVKVGDQVVSCASVKSATNALKIAIVGDSISAGNTIKSYPRSDWTPTVGLWDVISTPNLTSSFIVGAFPDGNCASGDSVTVTFDGTSKLSCTIAGDSAGVGVDVTGGGFFHLVSGTNGKGVAVQVRWANRVGAVSDTATVSGSRAIYSNALDQWWTCGIARQGAIANSTIMNFGMSGDSPLDVLARIAQVEAELPDVAFLMIGTNAITQTSQVASIIDRLDKLCRLVVVCPVLPRGDLGTTALAKQQAAMWRYTMRYLATKNNCVAFDGWSLLASTGTSGTTCINTGYFHSDYMHLNPAGSVVLGNDLYTKIISNFFSNQQGFIASGADTYDATYNPYGNLLGSVGAFAGSGGSVGINPVPTGTLAASWTDADFGGGGAFASVTYSQIARPDGYNGNMQRVVCATATGGSASRQLTSTITGLSAGMKVRFRLAVRLTSTTLLNRLTAYARINVASGANIYVTALEKNRNQTAGSTIDSGVMYFYSAPITVPADVSGGTVYIQAGCAVGGSMTLDLADMVVEPVI